MTETKHSRFSRLHYSYTAEHMKGLHDKVPHDCWLTLVCQLGAMFKSDNPRFIVVRFMQACGMTRGEANRTLEGRNVDAGG